MFRRVVLAAAVIGAAALVVPSVAQADFTLTQLTDDAVYATTCLVDRPLALDVWERPNIVFTNGVESQPNGVFHAWYDGAWQVQTVMSDSVPSGSPVMSACGDSTVRAAFYHYSEEGSEILHVPIREDSVGPSESVFFGGYFDAPSLAVDSAGRCHLIASSGENIVYARGDANGWTAAEAIASGHNGSIAVDPSGECHVVYEVIGPEWLTQIWYVHGSSGAWSAPEWLAGEPPNRTRSPSIAVGEDGRAHVAYDLSTEADYGIEMRIRSGGSWSAPEWVGQGTTPGVTVDAEGRPCIAHWGLWGLEIWFSYRGDGPAWARLSVDPEAWCGFEWYYRPGVAIDSGGRVHITYCSRDSRGGDDSEIWYATGAGISGVGVGDVTRALRLVSRPNPARDRALLRYELPAEGDVRLEVWDVAGRVVTQLRSGVQRMGPHETVWDCRDAHGRLVAPGVYFARVSAPVGSAACRIVVTR